MQMALNSQGVVCVSDGSQDHGQLNVWLPWLHLLKVRLPLTGDVWGEGYACVGCRHASHQISKGVPGDLGSTLLGDLGSTLLGAQQYNTNKLCAGFMPKPFQL